MAENSLKLNSSQTTALELETTLSQKEEKSSDKSRSISPEKVLVVDEDDDELDDNEAEIVSPR